MQTFHKFKWGEHRGNGRCVVVPVSLGHTQTHLIAANQQINLFQQIYRRFPQEYNRRIAEEKIPSKQSYLIPLGFYWTLRRKISSIVDILQLPKDTSTRQYIHGNKLHTYLRLGSQFFS